MSENKEKLFQYHLDLTAVNSKQIQLELESLIAESSDWQTLVIDLQKCNHLDSVGLNVIIRVLKQLKELNKKLKLLISDQTIIKSFKRTRLDTMIDIVYAGAK